MECKWQRLRLNAAEEFFDRFSPFGVAKGSPLPDGVLSEKDGKAGIVLCISAVAIANLEFLNRLDVL